MKVIENVGDLLAIAKESEPNPPDPILWYRGHGDKSWAVEPTTLRKEFLQDAESRYGLSSSGAGPRKACGLALEKRMAEEFRRRAPYLLADAGRDLVNLYFTARHHGLPTRLFDWTTNPLVALFFAVAAEPDKDGEIIAASPRLHFPKGQLMAADVLAQTELISMQHFQSERAAIVRSTIEFFFGDRSSEGIWANTALAGKIDGSLIITIVPDSRSGRMLQQQSCFSLHMPDCPSIKPAPNLRWLVPKKNKPSLQRELRVVGIRWDTLFPDIDHVVKEIVQSNWIDSRD